MSTPERNRQVIEEGRIVSLPLCLKHAGIKFLTVAVMFLYFLLAASSSMWNLSSLTRVRPVPPERVCGILAIGLPGKSCSHSLDSCKSS